MKISFSKYHGTGNDFILIDDRGNKIHLSEVQIRKLCDRRFGIGADGLSLLRDRAGFDFEMIYYNADGKEGSMCGNGGRCITVFARSLGKINGQANFSTVDGVHQSMITNDAPVVVKLKMNDVKEIENHADFIYLDTGSPHYVKFVDDVSAVDIVSEGRKIRYNERFREKGTNVNFVQTSPGELIVRTYERGVEDETLSCGTGVTASALAAVLKSKTTGNGVTDILTPGGKLKVYFEKNGTGFKNVWLEGGATFVYKGEVEVGS
jgi:diaminopimelate epimerase